MVRYGLAEFLAPRMSGGEPAPMNLLEQVQAARKTRRNIRLAGTDREAILEPAKAESNAPRAGGQTPLWFPADRCPVERSHQPLWSQRDSCKWEGLSGLPRRQRRARIMPRRASPRTRGAFFS